MKTRMPTKPTSAAATSRSPAARRARVGSPVSAIGRLKLPAPLLHPITVEQWGEIDDELGLELVDGRLERIPDVPLWHALLLTQLFGALANFVKSHELGWVLANTAKIRIDEHGGRKPDIFFVPSAMQPLVGRNLIHGPPPLVIEIVSPGRENEDRDRKSKKRDYAKLGVGEYWIVDFPHRRVEVLRLVDGKYGPPTVFEDSAVLTTDVLPGLRIPLAGLWPTEFENTELD